MKKWITLTVMLLISFSGFSQYIDMGETYQRVNEAVKEALKGAKYTYSDGSKSSIDKPTYKGVDISNVGKEKNVSSGRDYSDRSSRDYSSSSYGNSSSGSYESSYYDYAAYERRQYENKISNKASNILADGDRLRDKAPTHVKQLEKPTPYEQTPEYRKDVEDFKRRAERGEFGPRRDYSKISPDNVVSPSNPYSVANVPWDSFYANMTKQRFTAIIGILNTINQGTIPSGELQGNYFIFKTKDKTFKVAKDGSTISIEETIYTDYSVNPYHNFDGRPLSLGGSAITGINNSGVRNMRQMTSVGISAEAGVTHEWNTQVQYTELTINENGSIIIGGKLSAKGGITAQVKGQAGISTKGAMAGGSMSVSVAKGSIELTPYTSSKMAFRNGSASFEQYCFIGGISGSAGVGLGVNLGSESNIKIGPVEIYAGYKRLDINGALYQVDPKIALQIISSYAEDKKAQEIEKNTLNQLLGRKNTDNVIYQTNLDNLNREMVIAKYRLQQRINR